MMCQKDQKYKEVTEYTNLTVGRIHGVAVWVAGDGAANALEAVEGGLDAPEAAGAEEYLAGRH